MRSITTIAALLILSAPVFSQTKKAEEILKEVSETTKSYQSLKIGFTYEMLNDQAGVHEKEQGVLQVKDEKYRLAIAGQIVISNGETMWTYIKDANEVQINDVEEEDDGMITPTRLLTQYTEDFKPKLTGEQLWMNTKVWLIELKPKGDKPYDKVELKIDKNKKRIMQISIFDKNGTTFIYTLEEYKPNVLFKTTDFNFDPADYPGVEVIDMRL